MRELYETFMRVLACGVFLDKRKPATWTGMILCLGELILFLGFLRLIPNLSKGFFSRLSLGFFEEVVLLLIA